LPAMDQALDRTARARALHLDIDRDVSQVLDGMGAVHHGSSGLTHEQEVVLSYFDHPQSIRDVVQISRYEELDTCKAIADLIEAGLLEAISGEAPKIVRPWVADASTDLLQESWEPSPLLWPLVAVLLALPLILYVPHGRGSINVGLASLQPADVRVAPDATSLRLAWELRMASPKDGGVALARHFGRPLAGRNPVEDLTRYPDPLALPAPSTPKPGLPASR
ncbi:MAG TPA: hypothetical protein VF768_06100, partial [Holophagaceae bacterium]